jgi:hypothetical protein
VAFDAIRRRLAGMVPATVRAEAVGTGVADLLRAEARLSAAWERARSGARPALAQTELSYFVRNDPVPRLLAALATPDAEVPKRILGSLPAALTVPPHWRALAEALADNRVATAPNLTRHADLRAASARRLEPEFLFSRCGELPEGWEVRAVPTENGRVALAAPTTVRPGRNLRVEGAWDTQVYQWLPVEAGRFCIARAQAAGRRSPGNDSGLFLTFLTRDGKLTGTHRMQSLPDGETAPPTELLLADWAPADAAWVGVGVGASRQADGDWFEATDVELRSCGAPALR